MKNDLDQSNQLISESDINERDQKCLMKILDYICEISDQSKLKKHIIDHYPQFSLNPDDQPQEEGISEFQVRRLSTNKKDEFLIVKEITTAKLHFFQDVQNSVNFIIDSQVFLSSDIYERLIDLLENLTQTAEDGVNNLMNHSQIINDFSYKILRMSKLMINPQDQQTLKVLQAHIKESSSGLMGKLESFNEKIYEDFIDHEKLQEAHLTLLNQLKKMSQQRLAHNQRHTQNGSFTYKTIYTTLNCHKLQRILSKDLPQLDHDQQIQHNSLWRCDGFKFDGCTSGQKDDGTFKQEPLDEVIYHCTLCNYDMCADCYQKFGKIHIHHMNKSTFDDIVQRDSGYQDGWRCDCAYFKGCMNPKKNLLPDENIQEELEIYESGLDQDEVLYYCNDTKMKLCLECAKEYIIK
eukprot:403362505